MNQPPQGGHPPQPQQPYPQPPGQYPQPPQYPQGPQAYPPQYGAPYPQKRGPGKGLAVLKLLVGLCATFGFAGGLLVAGHNGPAAGAILGAFLGVSLFLLASGGAGLAGKKLPIVATLAIIVVFAGIGAAGGPPMSKGYWKSTEEKKWDELVSYNSGYVSTWQWDSEYFDAIPAEFHRPEAPGMRKFVEVKSDIQSGNLVNVRKHVYDIQVNHKGEQSYMLALDAAAGELKRRYDEALEKLAKPGGQTAGDGEFPVDEKLRTAFKEVLTDLARAPSADIHVAFTNSAQLEKPEGSDADVKDWAENPSVKASFPDGNIKIIDPGKAFSTEYDMARRNAFMEAATSAFREVFDANLLELKALEAGEVRTDKFVLEVSSSIIRVPNHFNNYETDANGVERSKGLLFGIVVDWELKLLNRKGELMYESKTRSAPANNISIGEGAMPDWGVYSILMDSAYYNYSREVVGRFGLTPAAERTVFSYRDYGISGG
jgi:hypothetical protein